MSNDRAFEGVWIPAALWLDSSLTLQEKVMLVEIKSLSKDPKRGCFKTNKKFAEFFNLSVSRVSEVIASLKKKGLLVVSEKREGKQIIERNIFLSDSGLGVFGISKGYSENAKTPIRNPEGGYSENAKESNTSMSNTDRVLETPSEPATPTPDKPKKRFTPPTVDEVRAYCLERGNTIDPQKFVDYYETAGWMRGKNKIKDWKACVRTWEANQKNQGNPHENRQPSTGKLQQFHDQINAAAARAASRTDTAGAVEANDPAVCAQVVYAASADGRR